MSISSTSTGPSRPLQCPDCPKTFSRPSHLSRHQVTHLLPSHKGFLPCSLCEKTFSRRDVLLRHLRSTHNIEGRTTRSIQKSCFRCVEKKLKCERTQPCISCYRSDALCEYPSSRESESPLLMRADAYAGEPGTLPDAQHFESHGINEPNGPSVVTRPDMLPRIGVSDGNLMTDMRTPDSMSDSSFMRQYEGMHDSGQFNRPDVLDYMDEGSTTFSSVDTAFDPFLLDMDNSTYQDGFAAPLFDPNLMQPSFRTGGFDWLGVDIDDGGLVAQPYPQGQLGNTQLCFPRNPNAGETAPPHVDAIPDTRFSQAPAPQDNIVQQPRAARQSNLPWPFDQAQDTTPFRHQLPPLREVLGRNWRANQSAQSTLMDGFIYILAESRLPQLALLQESQHIRAFHELQRLVDLYFARFHDVQAIIHRPTWNMASCSTVFLTAMACVGALLSDSEGDAEQSLALSDICSTTINWMGASDDTNYRNLSYLNALCVHQIYSLGSGNRQLYQNADRSRGILIGGLRGIGLLRARPSVDSDERQETTARPSDERALNHEWRAWVARESGRRAAWAAFEYDCSLCTLTSRRGIVDLSELPAFLPCAEPIWNASTAQAWLALQSRLGPSNASPRLSMILKLALAGRNLPSTVGSWAKRLCSQFMGRLLWDLKQLEVMATPEYCGLGALISTHRETKTSLLKGLNNLAEDLAAPSSTSDLISYSISGLLCHYSHLYAANDVLDIIIYIVRNLISSASPEHAGLDVARQRLRLTLASDPQTARKLCWHAAQIVVIANEYLVSAPCEIMRVFMGYIFVMAYSSYGPTEPTSPDEDGEIIRLDQPYACLSQRRDVKKWIQVGGPAGFGSVQDICSDNCVPALSRDAQSMMQKLRCWGLAERFTRMFQVFEAKGL